MNGWAELKAAFWAKVDGEQTDDGGRLVELAAIDPELPGRLQAMLEADARGDSLDHIFGAAPEPPPHRARIGSYEVKGVLGVGGMGEVYRARDARLQRDVAIKVLPAALITDPDRLARFEREAQVLAALKHRHIAHVYGLDETGGTLALVMECIEGPTLAQLIGGRERVPIPVRRALTIARQIADGLDAAHEKGIVHRDLKPGNVALGHDDEVKILDFGLARSVEPGDAAAPVDAGGVLGTPAYMSPEQARGAAVDRRTDIWSFGCVLYELLTGHQAFAGRTTTDWLTGAAGQGADWSRLPVGTPPAVRTLLRQCLQEDPKRRLRDIADARLLLDDVLDGRADESVQQVVHNGRATPASVRRVPVLWLAIAAVSAAAATLLVTRMLLDGRPPSPHRTIASIVLPSGVSLGGSDVEARGSETRFAVSPDGRKLALVAADESRRARLWIRDLASPALHPLPETDGASSPFWSPDSESVGFVAGGKLRTIRVAGGTPMTVHDQGFWAGSWGHRGIIFAPTGASPLHTVAPIGGSPIAVTTLDTDSGEVQHSDPCILPDGRHFLYFSIGSPSGALDPRGVYLSSMDSPGHATLLVPGATQPRYARGHIFFVQNGTLLAQAFDVDRRTLAGAPVPLVEDVKLATVGATGPTAAYSVSDRVLAYQAAVKTDSRLVWFDRAGRPLTALTDGADLGDVVLSPDGTRIAVSVRDAARFTRDLWLYDAEDGRGQRVTFDTGDEFAPVWSPDGTRLLFSAMVNGLVTLALKDVGHPSNDGVPVEVDALGMGRYAADWSRDGRHLMYVNGGRAIARSDLWTAPVAAPRRAQPLLESGFVETHGRFAPGGAWFLYTSNETGQMEVYADRFPARGAKRLVSRGGGGWGRWSRDGSEIFYLSPDDRLMAAAVRVSGEHIAIDAPRTLFTVRPRPPARLDAYPYDVSPDGQRFVVNTLIEDAASRTITLVLEWAAGLTQ